MTRAVATSGLCLAGVLAFAAPASAQMYPGEDVVVNAQGGGGGNVLLYPDGVHTRVVPRLREPGDNGSVIHLHMPVKHKAMHRAPKPVANVASTEDAFAMPGPKVAAAEPPPAPVSKPAPAPKKVAQPKPAAKPAPEPTQVASSSGGVPFSFDPSSSYVPPAAPEPVKNKKLASNTPAPTATAPSTGNGGGNLIRRSQILFAAGVGDPAPNALDAIRMLGGDLNSALNGGASRIQLQAYGGTKSDKSSNARRLSLKRALAIRQILIDAGVPSGKIDVRAMGGADDGPLDRVDVYVRA